MRAFPERPTRQEVKEVVETCSAMCAVDLAEVYSPAQFEERTMHLGLSAGLAVDLVNGWDLEVEAFGRAAASSWPERGRHC